MHPLHSYLITILLVRRGNSILVVGGYNVYFLVDDLLIVPSFRSLNSFPYTTLIMVARAQLQIIVSAGRRQKCVRCILVDMTIKVSRVVKDSKYKPAYFSCLPLVEVI